MPPAEVTHLFLKSGHGQPMLPVSEVRARAGRGLEGDASIGRSNRQVLLVDADVLTHFALPPGTLRENLVVRGLDLAALSGGTILRVGEVLLEAVGECEPCAKLDAHRAGLQQAIRGQRGLLARVRAGGRMQVGDRIEVLAAGTAGGG